MNARSIAFCVSCCLAALTLAACGGGGGSALPPAGASSGSAPSGGTQAPVSVAISVAIPSATSSSGLRAPRYVSAGTKSIVVTYSGGGRQVADCTTSCAVTLAVVPGSVTFDIGLYDAVAGGGNLLSTGHTTATIVPGQSNAVSVTFTGMVAKVSLALGSASVTAGTPGSIPVIVTAKDAAGNTVSGSDPYSTPIALSTDDTSG